MPFFDKSDNVKQQKTSTLSVHSNNPHLALLTVLVNGLTRRSTSLRSGFSTAN